MEHSNSIEKIGTGLVCSLETFKGAKIELVKRLSGFNGLSVYKDGIVRKIEIKTMQNADQWIAINGTRAIDKLFFERDYWIYFVLMPENIVLITKGLKFLQAQLNFSHDEKDLEDLKTWMMLSKKLTKVQKFKFTPKINVRFPIPIRKVVKQIIDEKNSSWNDSVYEIWQNSDNWKNVFVSPNEEY